MADSELTRLIGARLREERLKAGFEHGKEFAEALGISPAHLSRLERGERNIDTGLLKRAEAILDVPMHAFFEAPKEELVLARAGGAEDGSMDEMVEWTLALRRDIELVQNYTTGRV